MLASLLIILSMLASIAALGIGLTIALLPAGDLSGGLGLVLLAVLLGVGCVQLAREEWGLMRRRRSPAPPPVESPPAQRAQRRGGRSAAQRKHATPARKQEQLQRTRRRPQGEARLPAGKARRDQGG